MSREVLVAGSMDQVDAGIDADPNAIGEELIRRLLTVFETEPQIRSSM